MQPTLTLADLQMGDLLASPRALGFYAHYFVWLGNGLVLELAGDVRKDVSTARFRTSLLQEATNGQGLKLIERCTSSSSDVLRRVQEVSGFTGYDLVEKNCEHLARYICSGQWVSKQVQRAVIAGLIGFGILLLSGSADVVAATKTPGA